jgi:hypothetical protein
MLRLVRWKLHRRLALASKGIREQFNVLTILGTVVVSAVLYGWIEGTLYPYYPYATEFVIANHFTWYHVVFLLLFLVIGFSLSVSRTLYTGLRKYYLLFASAGSVAWGFWIEDMSYFSTRYPTEVLARGVWVEWGLSGFDFVGHWIPFVYALLCSGGFLLFGFAFLVARRDRQAPQLQPVPLWVARQQLASVVRTNGSILVTFALAVEAANLAAASLTNLNVSLPVPLRLIGVAAVVVVIPFSLLLMMDALSQMRPFRQPRA